MSSIPQIWVNYFMAIGWNCDRIGRSRQRSMVSTQTEPWGHEAVGSGFHLVTQCTAGPRQVVILKCANDHDTFEINIRSLSSNIFRVSNHVEADVRTGTGRHCGYAYLVL